MFPAPSPMMRTCTNPVGFVEVNGLVAYRKQFNPTVTPEMLAADEYYKENWGPRITKDHIIDFIRYWGIEYYITACSPDSTYAEIAADDDFLAAQILFYSKPEDEVPVGIRSARHIPDPYHNRIRDSEGTLVPEPPDETTDVDFGIDKDYIYEYGIVNYMLFYTSKIPMTSLLASRSIAVWQRAYIENLDL